VLAIGALMLLPRVADVRLIGIDDRGLRIAR
jgi:hypothetical protein